MEGFKEYVELEEGYGKVASDLLYNIVINYLQDKGVNVPEHLNLNLDGIMMHFGLTFDIILTYLFTKKHLSDIEIEVLHKWCTLTEYKPAREKGFNISKACKVLCKHQKQLQKRLGKTVDYCAEEKEINRYAPDLKKLPFNPDYDAEYSKIKKSSQYKLPKWWKYRKVPK
jgi:hypothetical protein